VGDSFLELVGEEVLGLAVLYPPSINFENVRFGFFGEFDVYRLAARVAVS
jgi:hypothetical protein